MSIRASILPVLTIPILAALLAMPATVGAARCDCGQPLSNGAGPTASDCLTILKHAVGLGGCELCGVCSCDLNGNGSNSAADALACLAAAVGASGQLNCTLPCPCHCIGPKNACSGAELYVLSGSELDLGWNGRDHDAALVEHASISLDIVRRCDGAGAVCTYDSECTGGDTCDLTCNCDSPCGCGGGGEVCEIFGPTDAARCVSNMDVQCDSNADCPGGGDCRRFFGPPLPSEAGGTPTCLTSYFARNITGTLDSITGRSELSAVLRSRVHLGIDLDLPCPRCGAPDTDPPVAVGDLRRCEGGPRDGSRCVVEGLSPAWGGVSSDCPPSPAANVSGAGEVIDLSRLTTDAVAKQAALPCGGSLGALHPGSGAAVCLDNFAPCTSNADCLRCAGDLSECAADADCGADGPCRAAPDQPIACGIYCHCGFCSNDGGATADPDRACFSDADCSDGDTCVAGPGDPIPQERNNLCSNTVCGLTAAETCCGIADGDACIGDPTTAVGRCSVLDYIPCSSNADCNATAGLCELTPRSCFENQITRAGRDSPWDSYCSEASAGAASCTSNADCAVGACEADSARPAFVSAFCVPPTTSPLVNAASGFPGPGAIRLDALLLICRCGNGEIECSEECDDGNNANGDGCDEACFSE